jgi:tripartite-type tricarboxylate transporter receptor subunit TctC
MMGRRTVAAGIALASVLLVPRDQAAADPVADFYKGRTVSIAIGTGMGGGYALYARLAAEFLGRHIPGNPTLIVQSMPGGGGLNLHNFAYKVAPRDGAWLFIITQNAAVDQVAKAPGVAFDARQFHYIGRLADNAAVSVGWLPAGVTEIAVARQRQVVTGGNGAASMTDIGPKVLNRYAGTRFKLITGYKGIPEVAFAMETGEVQAMVSSWVGFKTEFGRFLEAKRVAVLVQYSTERHPELKEIPTAGELAETRQGREVIDFLVSGGDIGRSLVTPPGVPADRLAALRAAHGAMMRDPALIAEAARRSINLNPASGEQLARLVEKTLATPGEIIEQASQVLRSDADGK